MAYLGLVPLLWGSAVDKELERPLAQVVLLGLQRRSPSLECQFASISQNLRRGTTERSACFLVQ